MDFEEAIACCKMVSPYSLQPSTTADRGFGLFEVTVVPLLQHVNIALGADFLELVRPHGDTDLADVGFAQKQHIGP